MTEPKAKGGGNWGGSEPRRLTTTRPTTKNGSLAVTGGRDISAVVNQLLALPFAYKVATQDWHPRDHISFAANHPEIPDAQPFVSHATVVNPHNAGESYETRLWPVHCVQDSNGARLVPELEAGRVDEVVQKGTDARVEMYSALYDPFCEPRVADSGLVGKLRERGITDVFVVGLAADYCVWNTAKDSAAEGFRTVVVDEGTRAVDAAKWEAEGKKEIEKVGVRVVSVHGPEVAKVRELGRWGPLKTLGAWLSAQFSGAR